MSTTKERNETLARLTRAGIDYDDACALRRISLTLQHWYEGECGDGNNHASWAIERDEQTEKPYRVYYPHNGKSYRQLIRDLEKGAKRRLVAIMAKYPMYKPYIQTDPRGCALYLVPLELAQNPDPIYWNYHQGLAVY